MTTFDHFDHLSPDLGERFHETLADLRDRCPVLHSDLHGGFWVATRYDDVLAVGQDWATFSSAHGLTVPVAPIATRNIPVEVDPPLHREYKRLINAHFTPAKVAAWDGPTRALVRRLLNGFVAKGACEFMDEFARPFPSLMFFEIAIGAPADQIEHVAHLASRASTPTAPDAAECWAGLSQWITDFVEERRRRPPRGDVVDAVIAAEVEGRPITQDEIVGIVQLLVLGGLETTAGALGLMVERFCHEPEIPALLRAEPERIPAAIEELLRLDSSFVSIARTATTDTELGGQTIRAGEKIVIYWASANRDEREFPNPDAFDLDRPTNRHLAFGAGPHRCAGSSLARANLRIALEELLPRLHDIRLQDGAEVRHPTTSTRTLASLPITFTPAGPAPT
ncbi:MAG TPA: cytochrome P450 [Acidimicrobiales bacterium]